MELLKAILQSEHAAEWIATLFVWTGAVSAATWTAAKAFFERKDRLAPERVADMLDARERITRHETEIALKGYAHDQQAELKAKIEELDSKTAAALISAEASGTEVERLRREKADLEAQAESLRNITSLMPVDLAEAVRVRIGEKRAEQLNREQNKPLTLIAPGDQSQNVEEIESAAVSFIGEAARGSIWEVRYDPSYRGGTTFLRVRGEKDWLGYHAAVLRSKGWLVARVASGPEHSAPDAIRTWARAYSAHRPSSDERRVGEPYDAQNISFNDGIGRTHLLGILATATSDGIAPMTQYFVGSNSDVFREYEEWVNDHRVAVPVRAMTWGRALQNAAFSWRPKKP